MSNYVTVVIKYDESEGVPAFHANMEALGGEITAVQFNDALAEIEQLDDIIEDLRAMAGT